MGHMRAAAGPKGSASLLTTLPKSRCSVNRVGTRIAPSYAQFSDTLLRFVLFQAAGAATSPWTFRLIE